MKNILLLYRYAKRKNITVIPFLLPETASMSIETESGACYIGMDYTQMDTEATERVHLAHETGHCVTGSFYNIYATNDLRQRHEIRADKWAIRELIPPTELNKAVANGYTELWDLAEYFGVTEDFVKKAICYYNQGNLATEMYFSDH